MKVKQEGLGGERTERWLGHESIEVWGATKSGCIVPCVGGEQGE